jgi:hypothetical protein
MQIGINVSKYTGITFTGGATVNGEFFIREGKDEKENLEQELRDGNYGYGPQAVWIG